MDLPHSRPIVDSIAVRRCRDPAVRNGTTLGSANMNRLAHAEERRTRLKNNTTRLSPAPDQAICNCWHKRTLAGYPPVVVNRGPCGFRLTVTDGLERSRYGGFVQVRFRGSILTQPLWRPSADASSVVRDWAAPETTTLQSPTPVQSIRSACIGSSREARIAGIHVAPRATTLSRAGTRMNTAGSQLFTP
jgi:hypothetical protein